MKSTFRLFFLLSALAVLSGGCLHDHFDPPEVEGCDTTYYQREIHPILVAHCTNSGCHDGLNGVGDYRVYEDIKQRVEMEEDGESAVLHRINLPVTDDDHMPNDGTSLSTSEIDKIESWIKNGYQGCDR